MSTRREQRQRGTSTHAGTTARHRTRRQPPIRRAQLEWLEGRTLLSNLPPVVVDDAYLVTEDVPLIVDGTLVQTPLANDFDMNGDPLQMFVVANPTHGTLQFDAATGQFTYTPMPNWNGPDSFRYRAFDGQAVSEPATVYLDLQPVDDAPVGMPDQYSLNEDSALTVDALTGLLANDIEVDGEALTAELVSGPAHGLVDVASDGSFTYTPAANFTGADAFTYRALDAAGASASVTVSLTVLPVNDAPVAADDGLYTIHEDATLTRNAPGLLGNDIDPDGDPLSVAIESQPAHGTLALGEAGSFTYTPNANYHGPDSFRYRASDGTLASESALVSIQVLPVNDPPTVVADAVVVAQNGVVAGNVLANDSDLEGDLLTAFLVDQPAHGTLQFTMAGAFTYTPSAGYHGPDAFTYLASDSAAISALTTVSIRVNQVPVAFNDTAYTTDEDTPLAVLSPGVLANDVDGDLDDVLSALLVQGPTHGLLELAADGSFTYVPVANFNGVDSFTYKVSDGSSASNVATVQVTILPVNDAPVVGTDTALVVDEDAADTPLGLAVPTDVDGDPLEIEVTAVPDLALGSIFRASGGSALQVGDTLAPAEVAELLLRVVSNQNGDAGTFAYRVSDGVESVTQSVALTIAPVNDPPVADPLDLLTIEDTPLAGQVTASDVESAPLTFAVVDAPAHGSIVMNADGSFLYTPDADYNGGDQFTFIATEEGAQSTPAIVALTIAPVNDDPVAVADASVVSEDSAAEIDVLANDLEVDGDPLEVISLDTSGTVGLVSINPDGTIHYDPDGQFQSLAAGAMAIDSFLYTISDGQGGTASAIVTVTILGANDGPAAVDDVAVGDEDNAIAIAVLDNDSDPDSDPLMILSVDTTGTLGQVTIEEGVIRYDPRGLYDWLAVGDSALDQFTYTISDGQGGTATATVHVVVNGVNDLAIAADLAIETSEDQVIDGVVTGSDVEGDPLLFIATAQTQHGVLLLDLSGTFLYMPDPDFHGVDTFRFMAYDGHGEGPEATVTITVVAVNDPPVAGDDAAMVNEDGLATIAVLDNDTDVDGDSLAVVELDTTGTVGLVAINPDGTISYDPNGQFEGLAVGATGGDSFAYRISDGAGGLAWATVTITIEGRNDPPVAVDDTALTDEDAPVVIPAIANDSDPDGDAIAIDALDTTPTLGHVTLNPDGSITYDPNGQFASLAVGATATDSFAYRISDGNDSFDWATVTITIEGRNDAPIAAADATQTDEDSIVVIDVLANDSDPDGDAINVMEIDTALTAGLVTINPDGSITYDPNGQFENLAVGATLSDTFAYRIQDNQGGEAWATVTITVEGVNDAPIAVTDIATTLENTPATFSVLANDSDVDGDPLSVVLISEPAQGTVVVNPDQSVTYTPPAGFFGFVQFTYMADDGAALSAPVSVLVVVQGVNSNPVAESNGYTTTEDTRLVIPAAQGVLSNDIDPDGDRLTAVLATAPLHGEVTLRPDGSFSYTPLPNTHGADSFTYQAFDGVNLSAETLVSITITPGNDAPVGSPDSYVTNEDTALIVAVGGGVLSNDADVDNAALTAIQVAGGGPAHGTLSLNPNGSFTYTPAANYHGTDSFVYRPFDGQALGAPTAVVVTIQPVVDPLAELAGGTMAATQDVALVNVAIGTFSDPDRDLGPLATYTGSINWGDGSDASEATLVQVSRTGFAVLGTHTYALAGTFTPTITLSKSGVAGTQTIQATILVAPPEAGPQAIGDEAWVIEAPTAPPADTQAPEMAGASYDPSSGRILVRFADGGSGLDMNSLMGAQQYSIVVGTGARARTTQVRAVNLVANGQVALQVSPIWKRSLSLSSFQVRVHGVKDLAGNQSEPLKATVAKPTPVPVTSRPTLRSPQLRLPATPRFW